MSKRLKVYKSPTTKGPLTPEILGQFITARRTQSGLRLEDAALLCNVSKDTLTKLENARSGVRFENVLQVCNMLGIELMVRPWEETKP